MSIRNAKEKSLEKYLMGPRKGLGKEGADS
jgi:hypothetical protein